ncbi:MAG: carboxypeptidase-like regulatory domain-containing protein [Myxococcales bacterium]
MASAKVAVHGEGTPPVKLRFKAGQTIAGRVQTSDGAPVEGAQVSAVPEVARARYDRADLDGVTFGNALSGPDGTFEVRNLEPGKYQMFARKEGFAASMHSDEPVMASAGDSSVSLVLKREGKIRGRVVDSDGKPVQHFAIDRSDRHDEAGAFEEPVLSAGTRDVIFEADGFAPTHRRLDAKIGRTIDLGDVVLTRGRPLSGTVLDAASNAPIPDALVDIGDPGDMERLSLIYLAVEAGAAKTGADGSFTLPRVDTTRPLALFAFHPSYRWWVQPLDPAASRVVIRLERGGVVVGRVLDIDGNPIAGRPVAIIGSDKVVKPGVTGEDGSFEGTASRAREGGRRAAGRVPDSGEGY